MVKTRDRESSLRRRGPSRESKHRILIVCEGKKTEPLYLRELQHHFRNRLVHVEINNQSGVPVTVVERARDLREQAQRDAKAQRDDNLRYDEIWCVCDVDEHPNLDKACAQAKSEGIQVALSNPCFELWALLHLREQRESIHRHDAQRDLKDLLGLKDDKIIPLSKILRGYEDAVRRAQALRKVAERTNRPDRNPCTNVDELTEKIRRGGS